MRAEGRGRVVAAAAADANPTGACLCLCFSFFLHFLFMQVTARIFNFMSLPFGQSGDGRWGWCRGGGCWSQIRLRISCRLQLQPNCQLDSPNFSLEFALFAVPHKSVQYFLYAPPFLPLALSYSLAFSSTPPPSPWPFSNCICFAVTWVKVCWRLR